MILVTTDNINGKEVEVLGLVQGSIVQSKNVGRDIMASLKTLIGGEIVSYSKLMTEARTIATERMTKEAEKLGADAITCIRYVSSTVMAGSAEIVAYGTAVKFK